DLPGTPREIRAGNVSSEDLFACDPFSRAAKSRMLNGNKSTTVRRYHQGRVRRLLEHLQYPGLVAEVRAEGVFIQLDEQGVPTRQENVDAEPPGPVKTPMDISGLSLDHVIPLAVLRFFILDDRARRLTVGTCLDLMFYFEMCQFDVDIDTAWRKWREIVLDIGGEKEGTFGIQILHSTSVVGLAKQRHSPCIGDSLFVDTKPHKMQYIHHPHAFSQVRSVGVQTNFPTTPLCNPAFRQQRQGFAFGKRQGKLSVVLSRSRFEDHPTRRCDIQKSKSSVNNDHSRFPENWQGREGVYQPAVPISGLPVTGGGPPRSNLAAPVPTACLMGQFHLQRTTFIQ
ncbi:hypothetical protein MAR_009257, partial [Mya arenaria]